MPASPRFRFAPLLFLAAFLAAAPASAQVLIGWGESPTNGAPTMQAADCLTNSGTHSLVITVTPDADLPSVTGFTVDLGALGGYPGPCYPDGPGGCTPPDLPPYWDFSPTGCRAGLLVAAAGFPDDPGTSAIGNPFAGALVVRHPWTMEIRNSQAPYAPNDYIVGHEIVDGVLPNGGTAALQAGQEYYVATLTVRNSKSTGPGACDGCCLSVGFLPTVALEAGGAPIKYGVSSLLAVWMGGDPTICTPVPARGKTWGSLKSAYR